MSVKQSPAAAEGSGSLGWLSSWFSSAGPAPVQTTKRPTPNPSKGMNTHHPPPGYYLAGIECRFPS